MSERPRSSGSAPGPQTSGEIPHLELDTKARQPIEERSAPRKGRETKESGAFQTGGRKEDARRVHDILKELAVTPPPDLSNVGRGRSSPRKKQGPPALEVTLGDFVDVDIHDDPSAPDVEIGGFVDIDDLPNDPEVEELDQKLLEEMPEPTRPTSTRRRAVPPPVPQKTPSLAKDPSVTAAPRSESLPVPDLKQVDSIVLGGGADDSPDIELSDPFDLSKHELDELDELDELYDGDEQTAPESILGGEEYVDLDDAPDDSSVVELDPALLEEVKEPTSSVTTKKRATPPPPPSPRPKKAPSPAGGSSVTATTPTAPKPQPRKIKNTEKRTWEDLSTEEKAERQKGIYAESEKINRRLQAQQEAIKTRQSRERAAIEAEQLRQTEEKARKKNKEAEAERMRGEIDELGRIAEAERDRLEAKQTEAIQDQIDSIEKWITRLEKEFKKNYGGNIEDASAGTESFVKAASDTAKGFFRGLFGKRSGSSLDKATLVRLYEENVEQLSKLQRGEGVSIRAFSHGKRGMGGLNEPVLFAEDHRTDLDDRSHEESEKRMRHIETQASKSGKTHKETHLREDAKDIAGEAMALSTMLLAGRLPNGKLIGKRDWERAVERSNGLNHELQFVKEELSATEEASSDSELKTETEQVRVLREVARQTPPEVSRRPVKEKGFSSWRRDMSEYLEDLSQREKLDSFTDAMGETNPKEAIQSFLLTAEALVKLPRYAGMSREKARLLGQSLLFSMRKGMHALGATDRYLEDMEEVIRNAQRREIPAGYQRTTRSKAA